MSDKGGYFTKFQSSIAPENPTSGLLFIQICFLGVDLTILYRDDHNLAYDLLFRGIVQIVGKLLLLHKTAHGHCNQQIFTFLLYIMIFGTANGVEEMNKLSVMNLPQS